MEKGRNIGENSSFCPRAGKLPLHHLLPPPETSPLDALSKPCQGCLVTGTVSWGSGTLGCSSEFAGHQFKYERGVGLLLFSFCQKRIVEKILGVIFLLYRIWF